MAYALRRRQYKALVRCLLAELLLFGVLRILWLWRPAATLWVFVIPYMVTSLALMFGNWCALKACAPGSCTFLLNWLTMAAVLSMPAGCLID